jgi:TRAP-type C4-dicarboxylate transport system substrate-binding protein
MELQRLLTAACAAIVLSTGANAADLRFSTPTPANHIFTRMADRLAGELSTDGDAIKVFSSNQMGDVPTVLSMLQTGAAEFTIVPVGTLAQRDPAFFGWFLPYQFKTLAEAGAAAKTEPAKEMLARLANQGVIGLGYVFPGQRHVISREPILTPADVQGMRVRAYPNDIFRAWWAELGGAATALSNPEIMPSLVTGVIDAVDTDIDIVLGLGMYTQAPHLTLTNHMAFPGAVLVSRRWWEAQSPERQEQIRAAVTAAEDWAVADMIENEEKLLEELAAIKGAEVHQIDTAPFEAHAQAVTDQFIDADPLIVEFVEASKKAIQEMK